MGILAKHIQQKIINMATNQITTTSEKFSLNMKDGLRGLLIAVITAVLTSVYELISQPGGLDAIEWKKVGVLALSSGLAYLIKNFFTPAEIVIVDPPKAEIKAVKEGASVVVVK